MEALYSSKMSVLISATWRNNPEDNILHTSVKTSDLNIDKPEIIKGFENQFT
jgi:hypothetical protein